MLSLVNHHLWFEYADKYEVGRTARLYIKWGHYPETDGKLDPACLRFVKVLYNDVEEVKAQIGIDKDSSSKNALFLEFNPVNPGYYTVILSYDRGVYSRTSNGKWCFGDKDDVKSRGYDVIESVKLIGFAKTYVLTGSKEFNLKNIGLELEVIPLTLKQFRRNESIGVRVAFKNNPLPNTEVEVRTSRSVNTLRTNSDGIARIELVDNVNVILCRFREVVDYSKFGFDVINYSSTLTILTIG